MTNKRTFTRKWMELIEITLPDELKAFVQRNKDVEDSKVILKDFYDTVYQKVKELDEELKNEKKQMEDDYKKMKDNYKKGD